MALKHTVLVSCLSQRSSLLPTVPPGIPDQVNLPSTCLSSSYVDVLFFFSTALLICFLSDGNSIFQVSLRKYSIGSS
jgi:hypothetical protein